MDHTLKVTNVLSDPTRFNMYQHMVKYQRSVTVAEMAELFDIHPNVARLHLSKLKEIDAVTATFQRTGKGGRPSRLYTLSDEVIELNFPHRDYKLLATMAIETFAELGVAGERALYSTGKKFGSQMMKNQVTIGHKDVLTIEDKIDLLEEAGTMLGMYPTFTYHSDKRIITWTVRNCPFKEVVEQHQQIVCHVHHAFLKGMFEVLFDDIQLIETENMFKGCEQCEYVAKLVSVS